MTDITGMTQNDWDDQRDMDGSDGWHDSHGKVQVQVQLISLNRTYIAQQELFRKITTNINDDQDE